MTRVLLAVNAGSSTLKFRAYQSGSQTLLLQGLLDRFGSEQAQLNIRDPHGQSHSHAIGKAGREAGVAAMLAALAQHALIPEGVVHRVVHGGARYQQATAITATVRSELETLIPLAPLHQPASLAVIDAFSAQNAALPQLACFDTAFHAGQDSVATRFAIARHWHDEGVRRYGFHGLSYAAINRQLPALGLAAARTVVCHLGSGASACAIHAGRSIASSMGFSALDGLMMGTRPGNLDPEVVLYWQEKHGMSVAAVRDELYKRSGLLGVSGISADMRELLASTQPEAAQAIELYCWRAAREVASLAAAMEGLDAVVFTAGVGEHAAEIRARILARLGWLGFELDTQANNTRQTRLTKADSPRHAYVLATDEEGEMARQAAVFFTR
ncbi:acetate/propionate family kinase [Craterilacuibacter sp. RT1T]|uniref:acetate/propionate family kinase n=1 Tax=Craterilacuibacter sp. RT1T TaxID=2942211 RepID=UPI0020BD7AB9|nr:acetate/propionate family kinase [Craterilacuibacter sp. RT1T]MCL6262040.1 acetate/propionate family kinase [Craterilacuibacter sp. RT1T]